MRRTLTLVALLLAGVAWADIPATRVMTLYQFNGPLEIPSYDVDRFQRSGPSSPAGHLTQGTSVIPCLVIRNGRPLTDASGTPYVGFEVVVDSRAATRASSRTFENAMAARASLRVANHHCDDDVRRVIDVRALHALKKGPFFDPPRGRAAPAATGRPPGELDAIVRAYHDSPHCEDANRNLVGRRGNLEEAWERFIRDNARHWPAEALRRARHLDYAMRTAIFEGHLDRGCSAYGACERTVIALSIRNRGRGRCQRGQGCREEGDFQGVSSAVSQYNIWDEYLAQTSALTSCFLRADLASGEGGSHYATLQRMYAQNVADVERVLFGSDADLEAIFPGIPVGDLRSVRHYYHPPAMGKCFPDHDRVEYVSGAVARRGSDFALIASERIRVDEPADGGYRFREFRFRDEPDGDVVELVDSYRGFVVDGRKVHLTPPSGCRPYGLPPGCRFGRVGRHRKTPSWVNAGTPLALTCRVEDRGETCTGAGAFRTVTVGGRCDTQMQPVAGVR